MATPAQIEANRRNALLSTGPSEEGKSRSRANSLKNGMTGAGIVLPKEDAAEVERLTEAFRSELKPEGEVGEALVRRMAVHVVRMDRAVVQESAALSGRVREAVEGCQAFYLSDEEAHRRRAEAGNRALFDASREAVLARKYEAASERGFHAALKELRRLRAEALLAAAEETPTPAIVAKKTADAPASPGKLGSFFPAPPKSIPAPPLPRSTLPNPGPTPRPAALPTHCDIPITIGRAR